MALIWRGFLEAQGKDGIRRILLNKIPSRVRSHVVGVFLVSLFGCGLLEPEACETIALAGLVVSVVSAEDGSPIQYGLEGTMSEGAYSEMMFQGNASLSGAHGRPGTYHVTIRAPGFETLTLEGVSISKGDCQVRTRRISVELEPIV